MELKWNCFVNRLRPLHTRCDFFLFFGILFCSVWLPTGPQLSTKKFFCYFSAENGQMVRLRQQRLQRLWKQQRLLRVQGLQGEARLQGATGRSRLLFSTSFSPHFLLIFSSFSLHSFSFRFQSWVHEYFSILFFITHAEMRRSAAFLGFSVFSAWRQGGCEFSHISIA